MLPHSPGIGQHAIFRHWLGVVIFKSSMSYTSPHHGHNVARSAPLILR